MAILTVRLDDKQEKKLSGMARSRGKSKSATLRELIEERIETPADFIKQTADWAALLPAPRRTRRRG